MGKADTPEAKRPRHLRKFTEGLLDHERILETLRLRAGQVVLDAGCGTGYMAKLFSTAVSPSGKVYALDRDKSFIDVLKAQTSGTRIAAVAGDITGRTRLRTSSLDLVYLSAVIHAFSQKQVRGFLKEVQRLLKPDAFLAIVEIEKKMTPFGPPLELRYSPRELQALVPFVAVKTVKAGDHFYLQLFRMRL